MGIEEDISQVKFRNDHQKALINLIFTFNWANEKLKKIMKREDLTPQQFNILRILRGAGKPISTLQIRQRMLDKMSDTSRIVDRLIIKQYVEKTICKSDKRLVDVSITDKGKALLAKTDTYDSEMDAILGSLNHEEIIQFNILLDKIRTKHK